MSDTELDVTGGAGGTSVALDALDSAAIRLRAAAGDVADLGVDLGAVLLDPLLHAATVLAPVEGLAAEAAIAGAAGPRGLVGEAAALRALADLVALASETYERGSECAGRAVEGVDRAAGVAVGAALPTIALPGALAGISLAAAREAGPPLAPGWAGAYAGAWLGTAQDLATGAGPAVDEMVFEHPWLLEHGVAGTEGVVLGLALGSPLLGLHLARQAGRRGIPYPPTTQEDALAVVSAAGVDLVLDESAYDLSMDPRPVATGPDWQPPHDLADLVAEEGEVSGHGDIRVTGIPIEDGRYAWVVDIPGTQTFDPRAGDNPWDLTSNVLLEAGQPTLTTVAVTRALSDAKARAGRGSDGLGDPVLVGGHSQGGITAAALAASPTFRAQHPGIRHVVTTGAPIGGMDIPDEVSVLSVEHEQDLVPLLDGADNPDRSHWVTVHRDVADELAGTPRASAAHDGGLYRETARQVDAATSRDPSLAAWRDGVSDVLGAADDTTPDRAGAPVVVDYAVRRRPREAAGPP